MCPAGIGPGSVMTGNDAYQRAGWFTDAPEEQGDDREHDEDDHDPPRDLPLEPCQRPVLSTATTMAGTKNTTAREGR